MMKEYRNSIPQGRGVLHRGRPLIGLTLLLTLAAMISSCGAPRPVPADPEVAPPNDYVRLGGELVVLGASNQFGIQWFPDTVTTVIPGTSSHPFRMLLTAGVKSYLLEGQDLFNLTNCKGPVLDKGAPGSPDNGYAGISGVVVYGETIYAIYHTEDHENMPGLGGGVPGYYATVSLAKSTDNGYSFIKLGPVVTSQKPKAWTFYDGQADRGAGEPCMIVSKDGTEIFIYYVDHSRVNNRGCQIFMAKTAKPANPEGLSDFSFTKYYQGGFTQPGTGGETDGLVGGLDDPVLSGKAFDQADASFPNVYYSSGLGKYIMVFNMVVWREFDDPSPTLNGIYYATSDDGIHWSTPVQIIRGWSIALGNNEFIWHPSIVWDSDEHLKGYLIYSKGNQTTRHYMVCRRIELLQ